MEQEKNNPEFLEYVLKLNEGNSLNEAFELSEKAIDSIDVDKWNRIGLKTYEEGKWTIHQIIQHLIDWERISCFRSVIFARAEGTIPVAHDQEIMCVNSNANELSLQELINELKVVRQSSILLFKSFNEDILQTNCKFFEYEMPLYTIGMTITAHQIHHLNVINERYLPILSS